jgi:hypothetical protein
MNCSYQNYFSTVDLLIITILLKISNFTESFRLLTTQEKLGFYVSLKRKINFNTGQGGDPGVLLQSLITKLSCIQFLFADRFISIKILPAICTKSH